MTWTVEARKRGGTWSKVGKYTSQGQAHAIERATHRGRWEARTVTDAPVTHALPPLPVSTACWAIVDEYEVKGFPTKPKRPGDDPGFMRFAVPIKVAEVRAIHWPKGQTIKLSRSEKSVTVTFPNGEKRSMTPTGAREWMVGRFGPEMGEMLARMTRVEA